MPNNPTDVPFLPLAQKMLDFLERNRQTLPKGVDGRGPTWTNFIAYVIKQQTQDSKHLISYLSRGVQTDDNNAIIQRIKIPSYAQCYKCVQVILNPIGSTDTRLRDIFKLAIHTDSPVSLPAAMLKARFFLSAFNRSKPPKPRTMQLYSTKPATTFELLFFLISICYLFPITQNQPLSAPPQKRRRTFSTPPCNKSRECAQVTAYAVQSVIRAWNQFANVLDFTDVESLTGPYLLFDATSLTFKPIPTRDKGFAPLRQSRMLQNLGGPTRTKSACSHQAWTRQPQYDADLRTLASLFLNDIYALITDPTIFNYESDSLHDDLLEFTQRVPLFKSHPPLARRFARLPKHLLDRLTITLIEEHDSQISDTLSTPSTPDLLAPHFPKFQQLPVYIIRFLAALHHQLVPSLLTGRPFSTWAKHLRQIVTDTPPISLAACEMSNLGLHVYDFPDYQTARVCATRTFCKGEDLGPLFGNIVYHDLGSPFTSGYSRLYADGEFEVNPTHFKHRSIKLSISGDDFLTARDEVSTYWKNAWIVPCNFCVCGYIRKHGNIDSSDVTRDDEALPDQDSSDVKPAMEPNVTICRAEHSFSTISSISDPFSLRVVATRIIRTGDEVVLP